MLRKDDDNPNRLNDESLGIYLHIPFCVRKCRYCDFLSFAGADADVIASYAHKLIGEISGRSVEFGPDRTVDTVYFGGGTPSLLSPKLVGEVLDVVYARYRVADDAEITLEANPGTVSEDTLRGYIGAGVNRLSIGAQSFDAKKLRYLGRIHSAADTRDAFAYARAAGFGNIGMDLIFGVPGETIAGWLDDMDEALQLAPEHLSFYSLTPEKGTPVFQDIVGGRVTEVSEIDDRLMYHSAIERLAEAGYRHYEISNAAKPGYESRHNLKYWSLDDYVGFGLGAHSYCDGFRFANTERMMEYMSAVTPLSMMAWEHANTASDDMAEFIFLGLRRTDGIDLARFSAVFGMNFWDLYKEETDGLIERGLLEQAGDTLRLTRLGLDLSNRVFQEYV
ncbi:MAG: radical SAM family heme chaperone HemW [Clostridiales Family XIII bacterium]|nr:radical SAM family heme chaperone HemW [Clostridiales Family XIII bacterium]